MAAYFVPAEVKNWSAQHGAKNHYYWLANTLTYLDEPGEYFYNQKTGTIYYYPAEDVDMANATISYPTQDYLMAFLGLHDVSFANLSVTGTDTTAFDADTMYNGGQATTATGKYGSNTLSAIYMKNVVDFKFSNCTFNGLGASALKAAGTARNLTVETCTFTEIGSSAIDFSNRNGAWSDVSNAMTNLLITDNYLDNIAVLTRGSVAVIVGVVKNYELSYNTMRNTSYSAVSLGWRWSQVDWEFGADWHVYNADLFSNYFESFMTDQSDGGAIYTLGGNVNNNYTELFNQLHDNFAWFTDKTWDGQGMVMPYYHDGGSSNWHTYNNVEILHPDRTVHTKIYLQNIVEQRTHNIMVENNAVVGAYRTVEQRRNNEMLSDYEYEKWIFGVDGNRSKDIFDGKEQYPTRVDRTRNLEQQNNMIYEYPSDMDIEFTEVMASCGSSLYDWDVDEIIQQTYDLYVEFYERQDAAYDAQ